MRYDYTGAAALFDEYYNLLVDPWELDENEKRQERREFMRNITRGDKKLYTVTIDRLKTQKAVAMILSMKGK